MRHSNPATLVVVDMQEGFPASHGETTLAAVEREVLAAIAEHRPVVVLEYEWQGRFGKTHERLMRHLRGYDRFVLMIKESTDGSQEVIDACCDNGFSLELIRLCGVETLVCIRDTAVGLRWRVPASLVHVVKDACNQEHNGPRDWQHFPVSANVILV